MVAGKRVLGIITARGGSKGVPGKNIRPLAGKPLIAWTVEAARAATTIDRTVVSTDAEDIRAAVRAAGGEAPFARPPELAGDLARQEDAVLHAMRWVEADEGRPYDYIALLAPTNPLRDAAQIDAVVRFTVEHERARACMTVVECEHSPLFAGRLPPDHSMDGFIPDDVRTKNRQELPSYHRICGSVCVSEWNHFVREQTFVTPLTYAFVVDARGGLDIDSVEDFLLAEMHLSRGGK